MQKKQTKSESKKPNDPFGAFWGSVDKMNAKKFKRDIKKSSIGRKFGYFVAAVVNLALIWIFRELPEWTNVLNNEFTQNVLWVFNILFVATAVVNVLYIFLDKVWFRAPMQLIISVISFFAWFNLYQIWPFDFTMIADSEFNTIMRGVTIFILVVIGISAISEFFYMLFGLKHREDR